MTNTKKDYQRALDVQNACNASGVIHSLAEAVDKVWEDARANGQGTDYVNTHPIVRMYVEKLYDLCRVQGHIYDAYDLCNAVVKGDIDPVTLK